MSAEQVQIRRLKPEEWQLFRTVRLKALENDPYVFTASYAEHKTHDEDKWKAALADPDNVIFGVFHGADIVGLTALSVKHDDPKGVTAKFWGSWLAPEWRRKGIARQMYQARIDWAKAHPAVKRVTVSHRKSNAVSKRSNQRFGFTFTHAADAVWNGQKETEFFYELVLKKS
jgi:RimJ/RimL family protein N-acetyltransferase